MPGLRVKAACHHTAGVLNGAVQFFQKYLSVSFALFALLISGCALTPSQRVLKENPALQPADGSPSPFQWTESPGDDFDVFYGDLKGPSAGGIGIYRGNDPDFHVPRKAEPIKGKLGAFEVEWYKLPNKGW